CHSDTPGTAARCGRSAFGRHSFLVLAKVGAGQRVQVQAFRIAQEGRYQHHDLMDAAADIQLAGFVLGVAHGIEIEPEACDQHDVLRGGPDLVGAGTEDSGGGQTAHDGRRVVGRAFQDAREMQAQLAVARKDVEQVPVDEPVVPHAFEYQVQLQPDVFQVGQTVV